MPETNETQKPLEAPKKKLIGHDVTVEGEYFRAPLKRRPGEPKKEYVSYSEVFCVPKRHGAPLSYILTHLLKPRLESKDKGFRGVSSHKITKTEDVFE